jgi:hypothetical protein
MSASHHGIGAGGASAAGRCLAVAAILLASSGAAAAGTTEPAPIARPAAPLPLRLIVSGDMPRVLDGGALRLRLAAELRTPVELDANLGAGADSGLVRIAYDALAGSLSVTYASAGGPPVTRIIAAPARSGETAELAVLLAGNLARDQAGELLGEGGPAPSTAGAVPELPPAASPSDPTVLRHDSPAAAAAPVRLDAEAWSSNLTLANAGARLSWRYLYALAHVSWHEESWWPLVGAGLALGATHTCLRLECGVDLGTTYLVGGNGPPDGYTMDRLISRVRAHAAFALRPRLTLFAGAGYALTTHLYHVPVNETGLELFAGVRL